MRIVSILVCFFFVLGYPSYGQVVPLPRAHAHNDYEHDRPLHEALERGFGSIEADIHLVDGELLVAHDLEDVHPSRTLQALYLDPLRAHVEARRGVVYEGAPPLILLIDVKSDAEATYRVLRDVLESYADILTRFEGDTVEEGAVTAIVSGNRPRAMMKAESVRYAAYDGRLSDLGTDEPEPASFIPLVSSNWSAIARWHGVGELSDEALASLRKAVRQAHAEGRTIRFWATADHPAVWQVLYEEGVDRLNTDDLAGLQAFLLER